MRKFLLPLITIGIFIGVTFSLKDIFTNDVIKEVNNEIEHEVYIDELNLPIIEIDTMNPILTKNKQLSDVLKLIYEPLFDFDEKNKLVPKLATEWNEKDDKTWIIKLNKLASWHSGKEFSAEDIIFTYNEINKSEDSIYKENIKNISSIEKLDEHTIQVNLLEKDRFVLYKLIFPILPKGYFDNSPDSEMLNGTGPYKYDSKLENGVIKLTANLQWWNSETFKLKKIYLYEYSTYGEAIKAFKSTEIDIIPTTMSSWQKKFGAIGINSYMYESSEYETIIANTNDSVLSDSSVRRAILTVINSENIIESVYNGNGEVSNYPVQNNSYLNFNEENNNYDIEKAKKLLINAGWDNTYGIWKKEIENKACSLDLELLVNSDNEEKVQVAELVKNPVYFELVLIARGLPPIPGEDGWVEEKYPRELENTFGVDAFGNVDYHSRVNMQVVKEDDVLCVAFPPTQGVAGMKVTGTEIPAKDGKPPKLLGGVNTKFNEEKNKLLAAMEGNLCTATSVSAYSRCSR